MSWRPFNNVVSRLYSKIPYVYHSKHSKRITLCQQVCYLRNGAAERVDLTPFTRNNVQYGKSKDGRQFIKREAFWVQMTRGVPCI